MTARQVELLEIVLSLLLFPSTLYWVYYIMNVTRKRLEAASGCKRMLAVTKPRLSVPLFWKWADYNSSAIFTGASDGSIVVFDMNGKAIAVLYPPTAFTRLFAEEDRLILEYEGERTEYSLNTIQLYDGCTPWMPPMGEPAKVNLFFKPYWLVMSTPKGKKLLRPFFTILQLLWLLSVLALSILITVNLII